MKKMNSNVHQSKGDFWLHYSSQDFSVFCRSKIGLANTWFDYATMTAWSTKSTITSISNPICTLSATPTIHTTPVTLPLLLIASNQAILAAVFQ
jgi:hypothetical protein